MKRISLVAAMFFFLFSYTFVHAEGLYLSTNVGATFLSDSTVTDPTVPGVSLDFEHDTGFNVGLGLGYGFTNNFRLEGELSYQSNDLDQSSFLGVNVPLEGEINALALMLNGYYDIKTSTAFTPFIMAGIGYAKVEIDDFNVPGSGISSVSEDDTVFAWQVGAGVGYAITEKTSLDLMYRYFATADPEYDTTESEFESHNVMLGLRFSF